MAHCVITNSHDSRHFQTRGKLLGGYLYTKISSQAGAGQRIPLTSRTRTIRR